MLVLIQKEVPGTQTAQLPGTYPRGGPGPAKPLALSPRNPYLTLREDSGTVEVSKSISKGKKELPGTGWSRSSLGYIGSVAEILACSLCFWLISF